MRILEENAPSNNILQQCKFTYFVVFFLPQNSILYPTTFLSLAEHNLVLQNITIQYFKLLKYFQIYEDSMSQTNLPLVGYFMFVRCKFMLKVSQRSDPTLKSSQKNAARGGKKGAKLTNCDTNRCKEFQHDTRSYIFIQLYKVY